MSGFHGAALYPLLQHAIAPLVALLKDPEDKMRANAAGALGNFVRNGSMLCGQLRAAGALQVQQWGVYHCFPVSKQHFCVEPSSLFRLGSRYGWDRFLGAFCTCMCSIVALQAPHASLVLRDCSSWW